MFRGGVFQMTIINVHSWLVLVEACHLFFNTKLYTVRKVLSLVQKTKSKAAYLAVVLLLMKSFILLVQRNLTWYNHQRKWILLIFMYSIRPLSNK